MSSTDGSPTKTGWKRRSSAASFSMCLRYSSSVVAPTAAQLAAREHRLEQVGGVHRALGRAGADDRVQLVDEQDDRARGLGDLLEHGLEPVLELAAVLRAGDQRAHVERDDALVLQRLGHVARDDALGEPSTIAVLPTPGSPISTGLFLVRRERTWITRRISSSRPMTGSSLPLLGGLGEVAAVLLERLVLVLRVLVGHAVRAAHWPAPGALRAQRLARPRRLRSASASSRCSVETYSSLSCAGLALGGAQDGDQLARDGRLGGRALDRRQLVERLVDVGADGLRAGAELVEHGHDDAVLLLEQDGEQVLGRGLGMVARGSQRGGGLEGLAGLGCEAISCIEISVGWTEIIADAPPFPTNYSFG